VASFFQLMTNKQLIVLKVLGLGTSILYAWSLLWVSVLYLYGGMYYPINRSALKAYIPFEAAVIMFSLLVIGLIFLKSKGRTFWRILLQDVALIIILMPFFWTISAFFENDFDPENLRLVNVLVFVLTILTININDWVKSRKKSAANKRYASAGADE
jgi:hypothetical protein